MRLIDADKLRLSYWVSPTSTVSTAGQYYFYSQDEVDNAPSIDAEPVRHGKWNDKRVAFYRKCSECGATIKNTLSHVFLDYDIRDLHYCPNCGAKMDGEAT